MLQSNIAQYIFNHTLYKVGVGVDVLTGATSEIEMVKRFISILLHHSGKAKCKYLKAIHILSRDTRFGEMGKVTKMARNG